MHTYTITTRTVPPTVNNPKRVGVRTEQGSDTYVEWDHNYDAPEIHETAARLVAEVENHGKTVTVQHTGGHAMGYTFRVSVGEAATE
jgi:hypothetical protein